MLPEIRQTARAWVERFKEYMLKRRMLSTLKQIRGGRVRTCRGICNNVTPEMCQWDRDRAFVIMRRIFRKWTEFSGNEAFPISAPAGVCSGMEPSVAYVEFENYMWDKNHPYGAARWRLLDFLIDELEKELEHA